jgi:hypothetical protein
LLRLESTPLRTAGTWLTLGSVLILAGMVVRGIGRWSEADHAAGFRGRISFSLLVWTALFLIGGWLAARPFEDRLTLRSNPDQPQPADQILQVDFGDQLRLVGADSLPQEIRLDQDTPVNLPVTVYWRALHDLKTDYAVFLHLDAPDGRTMATADEAHPENVPTSSWPPGLYLRNPLRLAVPPDLPPIRYDLTIGVYDRATNQRLPLASGADTTYKLGSVWVTTGQPALNGPDVAHFGAAITLRRAETPPQAVEPVFYWQTSSPLDRNYSIFIHLLDEAGETIGQLDGVPYNGLYPPINWQPNQIITDRRALPPAFDRTHLAAIAIGIYDPTTGERLPATTADGQPLPDNRLILPATP